MIPADPPRRSQEKRKSSWQALRRTLAVRAAISFGFVVGALLAPVALAHAQGFPAKPVRMLVPFPPGQATDIVARMLAERLTSVWNQTVIVDNRAGGGGVPGTLAERDAPADGYTVTLGTSGTIAVNPGIYSKLPYDPLKEFAMVGGVFTVPLMLVAHPSFPHNTVQELVDAAKKEPGKINLAFPGTGTSQHLTGELLGGQVTLMMDSLASSLPHIRSGKIKAIAMSTAQRVPQLPEVPTIAESGFPGLEGVGWGGLVVPIATPKDIVDKIGGDVRRILLDPGMQSRIVERGAIADPRGSAEFAEFVKAEIAKWGDIAKRANIRAD